MRKLIVIGIAVLMLFASCAPADNGPSGMSSVTVRVADMTPRAKSIVPVDDDGNALNTDITHYLITLTPVEAEQSEIVSSYIPVADGEFTARNIESGTTWKAKVEAFVDTAGTNTGTAGNNGTAPTGFVKVAQATSADTLISGNSTVISVTLSALDEADAGVPELTLFLPPGVDGKLSTEVTVNVYGKDNLERAVYTESFTIEGSDITAVDGLPAAEITLDNGSILQGNYLVFVTLTVTDGEGDEHIARTGMTDMLLLPGLVSKGDVDLRQTEAVNPGIDIDNQLGNTIEILDFNIDGTKGADGVYIVEDGATQLYVGHQIVNPGTVSYHYYIDGEKVDCSRMYIDIPEGLSGTHTLTMIVMGSEPGKFGAASLEFRIEPDDVTVGIKEAGV